MKLREKIENNLTIFLFSTLIAGFIAGFGAYEAIVRVSKQVCITKYEYDTLKTDKDSAIQLEKEISTLKAREGRAPSSHRLYITSAIEKSRPKNILSKVRLDQDFYLYSKWIGLSKNGYYEQKWQISDVDGLVSEQSLPFISKEAKEFRTWTSFHLNSIEHKPGKYRIKIFLNNQRIEDREFIVTDK